MKAVIKDTLKNNSPLKIVTWDESRLTYDSVPGELISLCTHKIEFRTRFTTPFSNCGFFPVQRILRERSFICVIILKVLSAATRSNNCSFKFRHACVVTVERGRGRDVERETHGERTKRNGGKRDSTNWTSWDVLSAGRKCRQYIRVARV